MSAVDDVDELIEQFHLEQGEFVKGNPEPCKRLFSQREDVTLNNPLSPPARGWDEVAATAPSASFHEPSGTSPPSSWLSSCVAPSPFLLTRTNHRPAACQVGRVCQKSPLGVRLGPRDQPGAVFRPS
jgi:hypothetical protein